MAQSDRVPCRHHHASKPPAKPATIPHVEGFEDPKLEGRNSKIQLTWMEIMEEVCHGCEDLFSGPAFGFSVILSLVLVLALGRNIDMRGLKRLEDLERALTKEEFDDSW